MRDPRTALYRARDASGRLLYVGISSRLFGRLAEHSVNLDWQSNVSRVDVTWYGSRSAALVAERKAIRTEHPLLNRTHNAAVRGCLDTRFRLAEEYVAAVQGEETGESEWLCPEPFDEIGSDAILDDIEPVAWRVYPTPVTVLDAYEELWEPFKRVSPLDLLDLIKLSDRFELVT